MENSSKDQERETWKSVPAFAKIIMLLEAVTIFFLTFWIYEEYRNNTYLQIYLNSLTQGSSFTLVVTGSISFFAIILVALYARLHRTTKVLHEVLSAEAAGLKGSVSPNFMDRRTEEHLIDMIRKKNRVESVGTTSSMPVLKRVDQDK